MSRDLDEFLRRAAERRAEKQGQRRAPVTNPHTAPAVKPQAPKPSPTPRPLTQQTPAQPHKPATGNWGDSNRPAPTTIAPSGSANDQVDQADERMSQHLRENFDHQMGNISQPTKSTTAETSPTVERGEAAAQPLWINELLGMLSKPSSIGNAVLLREILERPEHRW